MVLDPFFEPSGELGCYGEMSSTAIRGVAFADQ